MRKVLIMAILFALCISSCDASADEGCDKVNPNSPDFFVPSIKENYPKAEEIAKKWMEDAYLTTVYISFYSPCDSTNSHMTYSFFSSTPVDGEYPFLFVDITFFANGDQEIETDEDLKLSKTKGKGLDLNKVFFDSADAFDYLLENGGKEFMNEHGKPAMPLLFILEYDIRAEKTESLDPQWRLILSTDFLGPTVNNNSATWHIKVNAVTNEILPPSIYEH